MDAKAYYRIGKYLKNLLDYFKPLKRLQQNKNEKIGRLTLNHLKFNQVALKQTRGKCNINDRGNG